MAIVGKGSPMDGARGKSGDLIFRTYDGKTVASAVPDVKNQKRSDLQRQSNDNFKEASQYAKRVTRDPKLRPYYLAKARKMKVPNAYTAALAEHMRKPGVDQVDLKKFRGRPGDRIRIVARKKDFKISTVTLTLIDSTGSVLQQGEAKGVGTEWIYSVASPKILRNNLEITEKCAGVVVTVKDVTGKSVTKTIIRDQNEQANE